MDTTALIKLWNVTQRHPGTSGARTCAGLLLSLYNGERFPFDLTLLRGLDLDLLDAAIRVIDADSHRCEYEVHDWLNRLTRHSDFGPRFEHLAHQYKLRGRCKRDALQRVEPAYVEISLTPKQEQAA